MLHFIFSEKATKLETIFQFYLTFALLSTFSNFCGLLRIHVRTLKSNSEMIIEIVILSIITF